MSMHRALSLYGGSARGAEAEMLQKYGPIVDRVARWLVVRTGMHSAYDDLWSAGALGLIEASKRFDTERGATFEGFVEHRVRGAMLDELRRLDHLPRRLRSRTDDLKRARHKLGSELGREATLEEVATEMQTDLEEVAEMEALLEPAVPLESVMPILAATQAIDDEAARSEALATLAAAIEKVPERLRTVLGLVYIEGLTYSEIGGLLQVSEPRVCQLHSEALARLRKEMGVKVER
ncbi:MAG TPA: FliA/WhiG family RNA polymerase sigma factor [Polyangia bacterium]